MSRLIDANALVANLRQCQKGCKKLHRIAKNGAIRIRAEAYLAMLTEVILKIRNAPTIDAEPVMHGQWISVKDKLPKSKPDDLEYPTVIATYEDGSVDLACYYESTGEWGHGEDYDRLCYPIAWMPLPEPPKTDEVTESETD